MPSIPHQLVSTLRPLGKKPNTKSISLSTWSVPTAHGCDLPHWQEKEKIFNLDTTKCIASSRAGRGWQEDLRSSARNGYLGEILLLSMSVMRCRTNAKSTLLSSDIQSLRQVVHEDELLSVR